MAKARNPNPLTDAQRAIAEEYLAKWNLVGLLSSRTPALVKLCFSAGMTAEDVGQAGAVGVLKAARLFEPERGFKFSTYAWFWVRAEVERNFQRWQRNRIGGRMLDGAIVLSGDFEYFDDNGGSTQAWDVEALTDGTEDHAADRARNAELADRIETALRTLHARQRQILEMRFGLDGKGGATLDEVASKLGVTRERVRQIQKSAMRKIGIPLQVACFDLFRSA